MRLADIDNNWFFYGLAKAYMPKYMFAKNQFRLMSKGSGDDLIYLKGAMSAAHAFRVDFYKTWGRNYWTAKHFWNWFVDGDNIVRHPADAYADKIRKEIEGNERNLEFLSHVELPLEELLKKSAGQNT